MSAAKTNESENNFIELIDILDEAVSKNKLFFSNKSEVLAIIDELRKALPAEIQDAYEVLAKEKQILSRAREDAEDIRKSAENEADEIIAEANEQAKEMVSRDEITRRAEEMAEEIKSKAIAYQNSMYESTNSYVISILEQAQEKVVLSLDSVKQVCDDVERNKENFIQYINNNKIGE